LSPLTATYSNCWNSARERNVFCNSSGNRRGRERPAGEAVCEELRLTHFFHLVL
jgi:hypothetical protein